MTQTDPHGRNPHQAGAKLDFGKAPIWRGVINYFPNALNAVADVSLFGSRKYAWKGWQSVPEGFERYSDALGRHLCAESAGELKDPETDLYHAAHTAWNALARLELLLRNETPISDEMFFDLQEYLKN